jgi:hypothetical protein
MAAESTLAGQQADWAVVTAETAALIPAILMRIQALAMELVQSRTSRL